MSAVGKFLHRRKNANPLEDSSENQGVAPKSSQINSGDPESLQRYMTLREDIRAVRLRHRRSQRASRYEHSLEKLRTRLSHTMERSRIHFEKFHSRATEREMRRETEEKLKLAKEYRKARISGTRAQVTSKIRQSVEMRALRLSKARQISLVVLMPVLAALALWSTVSVHAGITTTLGITTGPQWWGAWLVEPAMISVVAFIIIMRAVLRSSGGNLGWRATLLEWSFLSVSILLSMAGHWPESLGLTQIGEMLMHSLGAIGVAGVAFLIGMVDDAITSATPERDATGRIYPTLDETLRDLPELSHLSGTVRQESRLTETEASHSDETVRRDETEAVSLRQDSETASHLSETVRRDSEMEASHPSQSDETVRRDDETVRQEASHSSHPDETVQVIAVNGEEIVIPDYVPDELDDRRKLVISVYEDAVRNEEDSSVKAIAERTGVPRATVGRYLKQWKEQSEVS